MGHPGRLAVGRREVDRDVQIEPLLLPGECLPAGLVDHPVAEQADEADLLGERDEVAGRHQPAGSVLPADECFHPDQGSGLEIHERLVVEHEAMSALDGLAEAAGHRDLLQRSVSGRAIERVTVTAGFLHRVHRNVSVLEQRRAVVGVARIDADADARADVDLDSLDEERRPEAPAQRVRHDLGSTHESGLLGRVALEVGKKDQELIAALTCDNVRLSDRGAQPRSDCFEQFVAGGMPEAVVDQLEVVEVDEENGCAFARSTCPRKSRIQMLEKRSSVRQARQRVAERSMGELLDRLRLDALAGCDVCDHTVDQETTVLRGSLRPHAVEHPAGLAIVAEEPVLDLDRLTPGKCFSGRIVGLAIIWMHCRVIRLVGRHPLGDRPDQGLEPDEREAFEGPVGPDLHLVQHDRDRAGDPLQELRAVGVEVVSVASHQPPIGSDEPSQKP